jgi:hypothetical protein
MRPFWKWMGAPLLAVAVLLCSAGSGSATDVPVTGAKLKIKDVTQPGVARRKLVFATADLAIVIPTDGGSADPTLTGGTLEILNGAGSGESASVPLPAEHWRRAPRDLEKPLEGWRYKDIVKDLPTSNYKIKVVLKERPTGSVLRAVVKDVRGNVEGYTLDEPTQDAVAVQLVTGDLRHCALFGGMIRRDESRDLGDGVYRGIFVARGADAPAGCLGSPSGAFVR